MPAKIATANPSTPAKTKPRVQVSLCAMANAVTLAAITR